jgi:amino-acid N-acetyltransferase
VATALKADKLIFVSDIDGVRNRDGELVPELSLADAEQLIAAGQVADEAAAELRQLLRACRGGVARCHLVSHALDGGVLIELFTHEGVGTMIAAENLESLREATADDVGGILKLIAPLEADGTLVKRPREVIEREIDHFSVLQHDGFIFGCAALYPFPAAGMAELACLTVHPQYREYGDGERLLRRIESRARAAGLGKLFVLTTRTAHWFLKRGFAMADIDGLPVERQLLYTWQRKSQILVKSL